MISKIAALLFAAILALPSYASSYGEIIDASHMLSSNGIANCSGQFVSPTLFLTAAHCVPTEKASYTIEAGGEVIHMIPVTVDPYWDIATLKPEDGTFPFVDVAENYVVHPGADLTMYSFPMAKGYGYFTEGVLTKVTETPAGLLGKYAYQASVPAAPGSSGGGLYTEIRPGEFELIGTTQGGYPNYDWFTFYSVLPGVHSVLNRS